MKHSGKVQLRGDVDNGLIRVKLERILLGGPPIFGRSRDVVDAAGIVEPGLNRVVVEESGKERDDSVLRSIAEQEDSFPAADNG
jgi:hypothetical protein